MEPLFKWQENMTSFSGLYNCVCFVFEFESKLLSGCYKTIPLIESKPKILNKVC